MPQSIFYRFGNVSALPRKIQWLAHNGPGYIAHQTAAFVCSLGFEVVATPAYSPESNGMADAFVKIFKRDLCAPCQSAISTEGYPAATWVV